MKRCDDQRQASSEELNRKTEDTHSKVWEDMMKTSKECDESRWDRAIKLLSESLGAAQACRPVNGPPIRYNPDCLGSSIPKGVGQFITVASIQAKYNECVENCKNNFPMYKILTISCIASCMLNTASGENNQFLKKWEISPSYLKELESSSSGLKLFSSEERKALYHYINQDYADKFRLMAGF